METSSIVSHIEPPSQTVVDGLDAYAHLSTQQLVESLLAAVRVVGCSTASSIAVAEAEGFLVAVRSSRRSWSIVFSLLAQPHEYGIEPLDDVASFLVVSLLLYHVRVNWYSMYSSDEQMSMLMQLARLASSFSVTSTTALRFVCLALAKAGSARTPTPCELVHSFA